MGLKGQNVLVISLLALFLTLLYLRTFIWLGRAWLTDPYYSHGFLVLLISCVITWRAVRSYRWAQKVELFKPGIYLFGFGLLLYTIGFLTLFPFLSAVSILFTVSGLILYFYGKPLMRTLLFPVLFFLFAIPLPLLFLEQISYRLQSFSAGSSASIIGLLGIPVDRTGSEIELQNAAFTIGLPCSGMNTLISLLALAAILIYLLRCPLVKKAVLFCAAVPVAIGANILRIVSILLVANAYGAETAIRYFHDVSSLLLFLVALTGLILLGRALGCKLSRSRGS